MEISACLASSWDGKITAAGGPAWTRLGSDRDLDRLFALRDGVEGIVCGAATFRAWSGVRQGKRAREGAPPPRPCLLTRSWELDWESPMFTQWRAGWPSILIASPFAPPGGIAGVPPCVEWLPLPLDGDAGAQVHALTTALADRGLSRILVEGGGEVVALFVMAGALQRIHLTVTPWLIGGRGTPSLMDGLGFSDRADFVRVRLSECQQVGEELFVTLALNYNVTNSH